MQASKSRTLLVKIIFARLIVTNMGMFQYYTHAFGIVLLCIPDGIPRFLYSDHLDHRCRTPVLGLQSAWLFFPKQTKKEFCSSDKSIFGSCKLKKILILFGIFF